MKKKVIAVCLVVATIFFGGNMVKAQQDRQTEQECAAGKYHWDLSYADFSLAGEAVEIITKTSTTQTREADIRASQYNSVRIGEELENGNQITPNSNFQLNVLFPNKYLMNQERSVVMHVHYPAKVEAGESAVISVHLKDSDGTIYEGEWELIATDDLWLTPGFMAYDGIFWESKSFSTRHWVQEAHIDWGELEILGEGDYSDMTVLRFYASTDKVDNLEEGYERGCLHGGCSTVVHSFYRH